MAQGAHGGWERKDVGELVQKWFLCFITYSVLGWCYEVFLEVVVYRWGFSNRGFLWGPYCPVYGFGALIFLFCLGGLKRKELRLRLPGWPGRNSSLSGKSVRIDGKMEKISGRATGINMTPLLVFVGIVIITTAIELLASYLLEWTTGGWLWDYREYGVQFQGRIALNPSLRFGLGGMVIIYLIQPALELGLARIGRKAVNWLFWLAAIALTADFIWRVVGIILGR